MSDAPIGQVFIVISHGRSVWIDKELRGWSVNLSVEHVSSYPTRYQARAAADAVVALGSATLDEMRAAADAAAERARKERRG